MVIQKLCLGIACMMCVFILHAQNIPNGSTGPSTATAKRTPVYIPDASKDYVRTFVPQKPVTDSSLVNMTQLIEDVLVSTQYFDELSRPFQTVTKQASPNKKDYVSPAAYDAYNRMPILYMPYAANGGTDNDGKLKGNAFSADSTFYKTQFGNEQVYYGENVYDGSPMNRVLKQYAPGNSWGGSAKGVATNTRANTTADSVRLWTIAITTEDDVPTTMMTVDLKMLLNPQVRISTILSCGYSFISSLHSLIFTYQFFMNTNKLFDSLKGILSNYFETEIINKESYVESNKIKLKIADFTKGAFDWVQKDSLFKDLKSFFPNYIFDNQTHFFYNDRCLRVYATLNQNDFFSVYAIRVSIFNFFSVYKRNYFFENEKYKLEPVVHFSHGDNFFADQAFNILIKYYPEILWLDKEILTTPVFKLGVFDHNIRKDVLLSDVLFTQDI